MFTGIIEEIGTLEAIRRGPHSAVLVIQADQVLKQTKAGDSIAVNGVCLTVTSYTEHCFTADVMHETLNRSALSDLHPKSKVNLERAMAAEGRFGGHIVSGHVDGMGQIQEIRRDDIAHWYTITADPKLLRYVVEKGSITIDGISLTVAKVGSSSFSVSVIPHTSAVTTLGQKKPGSRVNLEIDILAKYVEKLLRTAASTQSDSGINMKFLVENGF